MRVGDPDGILIDSSYSLFGVFDQFSEAVRKVAPAEAGEPVFLQVSHGGTFGHIWFEYEYVYETVWLYFGGCLDGSGYVSVADGIVESWRFGSLPELVSGFSGWYAGLWG